MSVIFKGVKSMQVKVFLLLLLTNLPWFGSTGICREKVLLSKLEGPIYDPLTEAV